MRKIKWRTWKDGGAGGKILVGKAEDGLKACRRGCVVPGDSSRYLSTATAEQQIQ